MSRYARKLVIRMVDDESRIVDGLDFSDSDVAGEYIREIIGSAMNEQFIVLSFNLAKDYIGEAVLNSGLIDLVAVDVPGLLRVCLLSGGTQFIVGHNHPSGSVEASREDMLLTAGLSSLLSAMRLSLLDHIIVGEKAGVYYSFRRDLCSAMQ